MVNGYFAFCTLSVANKSVHFCCLIIVCSFIHYMDLYSASSRLLLRSAPDSSTAKRSSFKARVRCVRMNPGEQSQCQWKPIPNRGAYHQEFTSLASWSTSKRDRVSPRSIDRREMQPLHVCIYVGANLCCLCIVNCLAKASISVICILSRFFDKTIYFCCLQIVNLKQKPLLCAYCKLLTKTSSYVICTL